MDELEALERMSVVSSISQAMRLIGDKKDFITNIYKIPLYNDEPKIHAYSATYKQKHEGNVDVASGFSFDKDVALMKVLGEGIERYCLEHYYPDNLVFGRSEEIKLNHLDPLKIASFSLKQLKKKELNRFRISEKSKFGWIKGTSLNKRKDILIPSQLIIFNYKILGNEPQILFPMSTGAAAGSSLEDALYRGICEIIERDAFMINYLNKLNSPRLDLSSLNDTVINEIMEIYDRYGLELVVIDLTTDLKIPAFAAITLDKTGFGPAVSMGLKAGFDIKETIIGAIEESLMTRSWERDKFIYGNSLKNQNSRKEDDGISEKAHYWFSVSKIKYLNFWLKNKNISRISSGTLTVKPENMVDKAIELLYEKGMEVLYVDIADRKIKKYGFTVVKVIVPQLQQLYLDERYPYLGGKRLYMAPVDMGFLKKPKHEDQLNKIPHPFL